MPDLGGEIVTQFTCEQDPDGYAIHSFEFAVLDLLKVQSFTEQEAYQAWVMARAAYEHMDSIYKRAKFEEAE